MIKRAFVGFFVIYLGACLITLVINDMFESVLGRMAICFLSAVVVMSAVFLVANRSKRYDYIDAGWGLSIIAITWTGFFLQNGNIKQFDPQLLVCLLVSVWGFRLFGHISRRLQRSNVQDRRYTELMSDWPDQKAWRVYLRLYLTQAVLALIVSIAVIHITLARDADWTIWTTLGLTIWLKGFAFESIGDWQLKQFLSKPSNHGRLMTSGLWSITRHPNYFGEITMWWGISVIALGTTHGWVGIGGAAFITYLIVFISGLPLAEKSSSKRPGWKDYKAKTAPLIPFVK
jgi:steroid 5-alpha reductase family enzyme